MGAVLTGPVLVVSLLGGVVALLAPCCVSVMLPAYLATALRRPARVIAGTLVFGLGVASVIVPIGLGAFALSAAFQRWHLEVFGAGGLAMLAGGVAVLFGRSPKLPMPAMRSGSGGGFGAVYLLGLFSGVASACCAPVLVGVTVLAGASGSFGAALAVAGAYVTGMVAPLLAMAAGLDRYGKRAVRALQARRVPLWPGARRLLPLGGLASGLLLAGMGVLTIILAISGPDMPTTGWRVSFTAGLQHATAIAGRWLSWLPGWALLAVAALAVAALVIRRRQTSTIPAAPQSDPAREGRAEQAPNPSPTDTAVPTAETAADAAAETAAVTATVAKETRP
jgi:cytochrome c-type biogenesis protein